MGAVPEVTILPPRELRPAFIAGRFDAVLVRAGGNDAEEPAGGTVLAAERLCWFAAPTFASARARITDVEIGSARENASKRRPGAASQGNATGNAPQEAGRPLPLATPAGPCNVWMSAEAALDAAGLPWREMFVGGSMAAVGAAVAALAPSTVPAGVVECGDRLGLPELRLTRIMLVARALRGPAADALRALAAAYRGSGGC